LKEKKIPCYGVLGFFIIVFAQFLLILKGDVFSKLYFLLIWVGYILFIDGLVYRFRGNSLIKNNLRDFIGLFVSSMFFWWVFEFISKCVQGWKYVRVYDFPQVQYLILSSLVFSTVLPAMFETTNLIGSLTTFKFKTKKLKPNRCLLYLLVILGIVSFLIPILKPEFTFPLIWISLFLIIDPINYLKKQVSVIGDLSESKWEIPLSLLISGVICGFFWELWNYWSYTKWLKNVPFFDFYRIFNISPLGYVFYFFFTWELFAMYHFIRYSWKRCSSIISNFIKKVIPKSK